MAFREPFSVTGRGSAGRGTGLGRARGTFSGVDKGHGAARRGLARLDAAGQGNHPLSGRGMAGLVRARLGRGKHSSLREDSYP